MLTHKELVAVRSIANGEHGGGRKQLVIDLLDEIDRLRQGIWDMATIAGMDTDGDTTPNALVYPDIVELGLQEVRELRNSYDEALNDHT